MNLKRGALVVIEGMDRTGKSTQCKRLVSNLINKGHKVEYTNFPNRSTEIGEVINRYLTSKNDLSDEVVHLLFSANRWEQLSYIKGCLNAGISIIMDRYCYSGVAFSAAKGLEIEWCKSADRGLPQPDRVFFLTMPVDNIQNRGNFGQERYEKIDFQKKVLETYKKLEDKSWETIDANRSIEEIEAELLQKTLGVIDSVSTEPLKKLWMECK